MAEKIRTLDEIVDWMIADLQQGLTDFEFALDKLLGYPDGRLEKTPVGNWLEVLPRKLKKERISDDLIPQISERVNSVFQEEVLKLLNAIESQLEKLSLIFLLHLQKSWLRNSPDLLTLANKVSPEAGGIVERINARLEVIILVFAERTRTEFEANLSASAFDDPDKITFNRSYCAACSALNIPENTELLKSAKKAAAIKAIDTIITKEVEKDDFFRNFTRVTRQAPMAYGFSWETETYLDSEECGVYCEPFDRLLKLLSYFLKSEPGSRQTLLELDPDLISRIKSYRLVVIESHKKIFSDPKKALHVRDQNKDVYQKLEALLKSSPSASTETTT